MKKNTLLLSLFACTCASILQADSTGKNFSQPFIEAARFATPAVVSIKAELGKNSSQFDQSQSQDPFSDDFWERFFGRPFNDKKSKEPQVAFGSGFFITADGYVVTNNHIIEKAVKITVLFDDGREFKAKLIGTDANTDIALLKVETDQPHFLTFADASKVDVGEWVLAIGNPLGLKATVTTGVISAKGRTELDIARVEDFLQTDAPINSGNSGGPLINLDGQVVGMNTAIVSSGGGYMGICFAIPSNLIQHIVTQLKEKGKVSRGYLGIAPQTITPEIAKAMNLNTSKGALVAEVVPGGPAAQAGVKSGDVVTHVNNQAIDNAGSFRNAIALLPEGAKVDLTIHRNGTVLSITAQVNPYPETETMVQNFANTFGMEVHTLTPDMAKQVGTDATSGVMITAIDPSSPAAIAGLRQGYVITSVNRQEVTTRDEFYKAIQDSPEGQPILFQVKIGLRTRFVTIAL